MSVYYNEIEPYSAQWLRNLIKSGLIAPGEVDTRSIENVVPEELNGYKQHHFFAGIGIWSFALREAGWEDDRPIWTGSCPCQPFSGGGQRNGFADKRHLWPAWFHLIQQYKPVGILGEQVSSKDGLDWFQLVQSDLAGAGYVSAGMDICAAGVGSPQIRQRLYWMAYPDNEGLQRSNRTISSEKRKNRQIASLRPSSPTSGYWKNAEWIECADGKLRGIESRSYPLAYGPAEVVGRLRAYGNALVGPTATKFIEAAMECLP